HAKIMTVDGLVANVGSANLNARSTELDEEINLVAFEAEMVRTLDAQFDEDLDRSEPIVADRWADRSVAQRVSERVGGLLRHQM
ncbi:MAG TPA: phospholipase D-like domain-containing protein, partial [Acidimicrobiales bacterium]|nr:phospholipase D-like domain-containing protein [Acidimicrobiales bacterium]